MSWFDDTELYDEDVMSDMYAQALYSDLERGDRGRSDLFTDIAAYCSVGLEGGFDKYAPTGDSQGRLENINSIVAERLKDCEPFLEGFDAKQAVQDFDAEAMLSAVQAYYEAPNGLPVDDFVDASFKKDGYIPSTSYDIIRAKIKATLNNPDFEERMERIKNPQGNYFPQELMSRELFGQTFETLVNQERLYTTDILGGVDVTKDSMFDASEKTVEAQAAVSLVHESEPMFEEPEELLESLDSLFDFGG